MPCCFPEFSFSFPEVPSFYFTYCTYLSKNIFPADCIFSSSCSELLKEIIFAMLLFFSSWNSLLTNLWCLLDNPKVYTLSMIFMYFAQFLASMIPWKKWVSEHLQYFKNFRRNLTQIPSESWRYPQSVQLYCAQRMIVGKIR